MPLVLHPSSCCDVCLDSYTFQVADDAPHAIPCGHIFCRACLVTVEPTNCPLCRKAFNRERIKKLHVDRPETDTEADLLQRVALAFDAETVTKAQLSTDLAAWLAGRSDDDVIALLHAPSASLTRPDSPSTWPSAKRGLLSRHTTSLTTGRRMISKKSNGMNAC
ncbi:hypothetical protein FB451DRAFT_550815 [Mycena latifolia]|nr:hypothetical protein FB451DRAFT_550815 [Mycena latifolia]